MPQNTFHSNIDSYYVLVPSGKKHYLSHLYQLHDDVIKWKHFSTLLAICAGNSPVPGEFPTQRPVTRSFDVFFDLRLNKWLSKQSWGWWFETLSGPLWRQCNDCQPIKRHVRKFSVSNRNFKRDFWLSHPSPRYGLCSSLSLYGYNLIIHHV